MRLFGLDYFILPAGVSSRAKKMRRKKSVEFGNYGATNHLASGNKVSQLALHLREYDGIDVDIDAATSGASSEGEDDDDPPPPPNVTLHLPHLPSPPPAATSSLLVF